MTGGILVVCVWLVGYIAASAVLSTKQVTASSINSAVNFFTAPTYQVTALTGGQLWWSALGLNPSAANNANGTIQQTASFSLTQVGAVNGNDNIVFTVPGTTNYLGTDSLGLSTQFSVAGKNYATSLFSSNSWGDNYTQGAGLYATVTYTTLASGSTTPPVCVPPSFSTAALSSPTPAAQTFSFCYINYAGNIFDEYTTSVYWAGTAMGTITATPTTTAGKYLVTSVNGYRAVTNNDGTYSIASNTSLRLNTAYTSYIYYNSPLLINGSGTDASGLALLLNYVQQDASGCTGNSLIIEGQTVQCANGAYSNVQNYFVVAPASVGVSCSPIVYQTQAYQCGIGPYQFGALSAGPDLSVNQNGYIIYFRMCGAVVQTDCVNKFGLNNMICQWGSSTNLYEISSYLSPQGSPQFSYINGYDGGAGIQMVVKDGQSCNAQYLYPRQVTVTILCGATTQLINYHEGGSGPGLTCNYFLTLLTPLACPAATPVVTSPYCGIGNYNFTLLAYGSDTTAQFLGQSIWLRLCGAVRQRDCVNAYGYNMEVCQHQNGGGIYPISATNPNTYGGSVLWSYINGVDGSAGIGLNLSTGASCGSPYGNRKANITITCGAATALLTFAEVIECTYVMTMTSPFACNGGVGAGGSALIPSAVATTQQFGFCIQSYANNIIPGYTIWTSSVQGTLTAATSNIPFWNVQSISGTRLVASSSLTGTAGSTVNIIGLEPVSNCFGGCSNILYYTPDNPTAVYLDAQGLTFDLAQSQVDPSGCTGSSINLNYNGAQCGNSSGASATTLTTGSSTATFVLVALSGGATAPACGVPAVTSTPPLSLPTQPTCGVGPYNFQSLAAGPDLSVTMNGYTIYGRLCGAVSQPDCVRNYGANVQFCQWGSASTNYEMAQYIAPNGETTFSYANGANGNAGIFYQIKDGATCTYNGVTFPRSVSGVITCGAQNALTYYNELSGLYGIQSFECQYIVNMTSPLVCLPSTQFSMCLITYSPAAEFSTANLWTTIVSGTFTVSQTLGGTSSASATVTAFSGTRSVASSDGLGRVVGSTTVTLGSCANCDQQFYWPPSAATGLFDNQGLGLTLGNQQADASGCITTHLTLKANGAIVCDNMIQFAGTGSSSALQPSIQIYPITSGYSAPACQPPVQVAAPYNCSIGPYNFAPLSSLPDLYGAFGGYTLYMKICGAVTQPDCVRLYGQNVQVCQWANSQAAYVEAMANAPSGSMVWSYVNGANATNGIQFVLNDGGYCGAKSPPGPRAVVGTITCGTANAITSYGESPTCTYNFGITSPLACPRQQTFGFCMYTSNGPNVAYNNCQPHIAPPLSPSS